MGHFFYQRLKNGNSTAYRIPPAWGQDTRRKLTVLFVLLLIFGLLVTLIGAVLLMKEVTNTDNPPLYVGIDVAYDDEENVYKVADAVEGYVNLIILGSLNVTTDTAKLTRVCDYLYNRGFYFIIYVAFALGVSQPPYLPPQGPDANFFLDGMKRWSDKLLGAYIFDEAGGKYIDVTTAAELELGISRKSRWIRAAKSGVVHPDVELGARVAAGATVATIVDPYGKRLSRLKARAAGIVIGQSQHPLVNQGDAVAHLAEVTDTVAAL